MLIFRKPRHLERGDTETTQQILIVFLVGERPTSGVHKIALGKAINIVDRFERRRTDPDSASSKTVCFDILGPYFTGSERSLSVVIKEWTDRQRSKRSGPAGVPAIPRRTLWDFKVRSGASNRIDRAKFRSDAGDDGRTSLVRVEFDGTLHYFNHILSGLFNYLKKLNGGHALGKVAILTESDTEFGKLNFDIKESKKIFGTEKITHMKFPFHISQVAIAYDQNRQADDSKAPPPVLARPSSKLRIPFDETGSPRDIVPALSPALSAASDEFDTAKILETISLEDYRYVGIVATDTRRAILLAGLNPRLLPRRATLLRHGAILLLGHPTYGPSSAG